MKLIQCYKSTMVKKDKFTSLKHWASPALLLSAPVALNTSNVSLYLSLWLWDTFFPFALVFFPLDSPPASFDISFLISLTLQWWSFSSKPVLVPFLQIVPSCCWPPRFYFQSCSPFWAPTVYPATTWHFYLDVSQAFLAHVLSNWYFNFPSPPLVPPQAPNFCKSHFHCPIGLMLKKTVVIFVPFVSLFRSQSIHHFGPVNSASNM